MADARGAMALRQAAAEPELDAQVAVLATHLELCARIVIFCLCQQSVLSIILYVVLFVCCPISSSFTTLLPTHQVKHSKMT